MEQQEGRWVQVGVMYTVNGARGKQGVSATFMWPIATVASLRQATAMEMLRRRARHTRRKTASRIHKAMPPHLRRLADVPLAMMLPRWKRSQPPRAMRHSMMTMVEYTRQPPR